MACKGRVQAGESLQVSWHGNQSGQEHSAQRQTHKNVQNRELVNVRIRDQGFGGLTYPPPTRRILGLSDSRVRRVRSCATPSTAPFPAALAALPAPPALAGRTAPATPAASAASPPALLAADASLISSACSTGGEGAGLPVPPCARHSSNRRCDSALLTSAAPAACAASCCRRRRHRTNSHAAAAGEKGWGGEQRGKEVLDR